jgi:hypothetical protein
VAFECGSLRQFYEQVLRARTPRPICHVTRTMQLFPALSDAYPLHYPAALCTWEVFLWLRCLFDSRAFHLKARDGSLMPSLLPGADMFNYRCRLLPSHLTSTLIPFIPFLCLFPPLLQRSAPCCAVHP